MSAPKPTEAQQRVIEQLDADRGVVGLIVYEVSGRCVVGLEGGEEVDLTREGEVIEP